MMEKEPTTVGQFVEEQLLEICRGDVRNFFLMFIWIWNVSVVKIYLK